MDAGAFARGHDSYTVSAALSSPELQKAVEAAVDASIKREELLLDKLLLVVGLYSTILSVLALATVIFSRQDAEKQLDNIKAKSDALASSVLQQLDAIRDKAQTEFESLKGQVVTQFPFVSQTKERIWSLILKLEGKYPEDEDLNLPRKSTWGKEQQQEDTLIDESLILAASVVGLDDATLVKLYLVLARFYFQRFRTGPLTGSDAVRAYLYAKRAIDCDPKSTDAYRMRGATMLSRFEAASEDLKKTDEYQDLLRDAKSDFNQCRKLDPCDAGAFYNLALVSTYEGNTDEAIHLSEQLINDRQDVPRLAKEKYLPDIYVNMACFIAKSSKNATKAARKEMHDRIVKDCTEGRDYLRDEVRSSRALGTFRESMKRELGEKGDFAALPESTRNALQDLL